MKRINSIHKLPKLPPGSNDVQLIFAFKKGEPNYAEVIQVFLIPGELYTSIVREEKIKILSDHGADETEDKRLYRAIVKYSETLEISLQEFIPF